MSSPVTPIHIGYEDALSRAIIVKILALFPERFYIGSDLHRGGWSHLKKNIRRYNAASFNISGLGYFILTDLDRRGCVVEFINEWLQGPCSPRMLLRVAVREVESWVLADRDGIAELFGINIANVPRDPDTLDDPKRRLIQLAKTSRTRRHREEIPPTAGSTSSIGPGYNPILIDFIERGWNLQRAMENSESLRRCVKALEGFVVQ